MVDLKKYDEKTLKSTSEILTFIINNTYEMGYSNFVEQVKQWYVVYGFTILSPIRDILMEIISDEKIKIVFKEHYILNKKRLKVYNRRVKLELIKKIKK